MQTKKKPLDVNCWFAETWITAKSVKEHSFIAGTIFKGLYQFVSYPFQQRVFFFIVREVLTLWLTEESNIDMEVYNINFSNWFYQRISD